MLAELLTYDVLITRAGKKSEKKRIISSPTLQLPSQIMLV